MYKKLLQFKTFLIVCLLAMVGTSNVWGQNTKEFSFGFTTIGSTGWSSSYSSHTYGYTEGTVSFTAASKQSSTITDVPVTKGQPVEFVMKEGFTISDVTFSCKQWGSKAQTITLHYSTDGGKNYTSTGVTSTNFTIAKNDLPTGTNAVKITFSSTSNQVGVSSVKLTYTSSTSASLTDNDLTLNATGKEFDLKDGANQTFQLTNSGNADGALSYESDNTAVATVSESGLITAIGEGTATITVTQAESSTYNGGTATCTVTVTDSRYTISDLTFTAKCGDGSGTADDGAEWTVASDGEESAFDSDKGIHYGTKSACVQYIVLSTSDINGTIKKIVVNASAANDVTATVGVTVGGSAFGDEAQSLTTSATDYTFTGSAEGEIIVTVTKPSSATKAIYVKSVKVYYEPSTDPIINASNPDELTYDATNGSIAYTLTNEVTGGVVTATSSESWLTPGTVTATDVPFTCTANEANTERTATVTLTYTYGDNETVTKDVTVTQAEYVVPFEPTTWTLSNTITSGKHYIITNGSTKAMGTQASNNRKAVDVTINNDVVSVANSDVTEFVIYGPDADGYYTIFDGTGYLYAASSSSNNLKTETTLDSYNNGLWKITFSENGASIVADKSSNRNVMQFNSGSDLFSCYADATQSAVSLYEKDGEDIPTENKTLNAYGYATYCSQNALDFSDDSEVTAWAISEANSTTGVITFTQITGRAAAGTGMLLKGDSNASVTLTSASGKDDLTNLLIGTTKAHTVLNNGDYYGLSGNTFVPVNAGTVPAGKALLPSNRLTSGSGEVRAYTFVFVDPTTGISETQTVSAEQFGEIFNLAGQRIGQPQKGVNIINGKKVLVK